MKSILDRLKSISSTSNKQKNKVEKIKNYRLIFSINSGRSGSQYLAKLLDSAKEVTAFHEAEPKMTGKYLRLAEHKTYKESREERRVKSLAIREKLLQLPRNQVYCDTSNMFIKTFYDVIMEDFKDNEIGVIILRRKLATVLKSFMECGYFSNKNENWDDLLPRPDAVTSAVFPISLTMDKYDRCISYLVDIEARAIRFQNEYPKTKIYNIRLEELQQIESVQELFNNLKITMTEETYKIYDTKFNSKIERKEKLAVKVSLEYCQERILKYLDRAKSKGIKIPETLATS